MKRFLRAFLLSLLSVLLLGSMVMAYPYMATITVSESGGVSYGEYPFALDIDNSYLASANYIALDALDVIINDSAGVSVPMLPVTDKTWFVATVGANDNVRLGMTMGNTPKASHEIVVGNGGYITRADDTDWELGNNFEIEFSAYIEPSLTYVDKPGAFSITTDATHIYAGIRERSWVDPTASSQEDYSGGSSWSDLPNAYDNNAATRASTSMSASGRSDWINFNHAGVMCDAVQYRLEDNYYPENDLTMYLDVYYGGAWHTVVNGSPPIQSADTSVSLGGNYYLTSARVRFTNNNASSNTSVFFYEFDFGGYVYSAVSVSSAFSAGDSVIKASADGVNLKLYIDGIGVDSVALGGDTVPDNANAWILTPSPYFDYYKHTVNGTLVGWYQPNTIISGTTLPDRAGSTEDGVITWGSNPANLAVSVGPISGGENLIVAPNTGGKSYDIAPPIGGEEYGVPNATPDTPLNPIMDAISTVMSISGSPFTVPVQILWIILATCVILACMVISMRYLPNQLIGSIVCIGLSILFWKLHVYPFAMVVFICFVCVSILIWERKPSV